ncbi:Putative ankyrin repeat-containing domain superfamily [Septoria linicola]|uniref:Ankyrin repeat-containing domain superfamily n=1 Tax=Septoria linicola TaxID=215465 RepID=A0A9Q9EH26_9PEZI|nr:putative ankyrin repeat-containing domain superfamily [Septoria linicola]USW51376.1 Putative ankyrin repeat-containing domain superfamily [Septoria linicola]
MGLPQQQDQQPPTVPPTATSQPSSKPQLPPEAIELATKLFDFARHGDTSSLSQYVSAGIPVNLTNHKGDTLLMLAAYHGNLTTVKMLVEKGAEIDGLNDRGQSIVAGAVFKGYGDVVKFLAENGSDLAAGQPNAIEAAQMFQRDDMLRFFGIENTPANGGDAAGS